MIDDGPVAIVSAGADNDAVIGDCTAGRVRLSPAAVSAGADNTHGAFRFPIWSRMCTPRPAEKTSRIVGAATGVGVAGNGTTGAENAPTKGDSCAVVGGEGPLEPVSLRTSSRRLPTEPALDSRSASASAWAKRASASSTASLVRLTRRAREADDAMGPALLLRGAAAARGAERS